MVSDAEKHRVGTLIRNRRQQLGWDQLALARRVGVSRNAVSNWERGRAYPLRYLGKIEAVLRVSLAADAPDPREREIRELAARTGLTELEAAEWVAVFRRRNPPAARELAS